MTKVVDAHLHLFRTHRPEHPRTTYATMAEADREELAERLLVAMEEAGVDHAVVVPLSKEDHYLREVLTRFPGTFGGIGFSDHTRPDGVAVLRERLDLTPMNGLRFYGLGATPDTTPETLACYPVLEMMAELGLIMWFYGDRVQLDLLDVILDRLPSLRVVMNHSAFLPDITAEMRVDEFKRPHFDVELPPPGLVAVERMAARHPSLHVHFSGQYAFSKEPYPYLDLKGVAERLHRAFGADRMLMASDWPWIEFEPGYQRVLAVVDHLLPDITPVERAAIRGGTAARLFGF
jgi:predicted TIM-barrel fold metal-dependent hydrolase